MSSAAGGTCPEPTISRPTTSGTEIGTATAGHVQSLLRHLRGLTLERLLERGIHREIETILDRVAVISDAIRADYFQANVEPSVTQVEP